MLGYNAPTETNISGDAKVTWFNVKDIVKFDRKRREEEEED
jgi:hypothetical protein